MVEAVPTYECLRAAGSDPDVMHDRRLLVGGCGNAGSNATPTLSVLGIEAAYVDPDRVEPKNLAHSPFLDATPLPDGSRPFKAELLAKAHVAHSRRPDQVAHWAALPLQAITSFIGIVLVIVFFVTSSDSGSLVIDTITAGGKVDAPVPQRVFWASFEGLVAIALLLGGGLGALQAMAVSTGFPFTIVLLLACFAILKGLANEPR